MRSYHYCIVGILEDASYGFVLASSKECTTKYAQEMFEVGVSRHLQDKLAIRLK